MAKRPLPFYRTVGYADDGCYSYECLTCKSGWTGRDIQALFCPYCGIKFTHLKTRPTDVPRWVWDRWGEDGMPWEVRNKIYTCPAPCPSAVWVVEYRYRWRGQEWGEWEFDRVLKGTFCNARVAKNYLTHRRDDGVFKSEYRIRRLTRLEVEDYNR